MITTPAFVFGLEIGFALGLAFYALLNPASRGYAMTTKDVRKLIQVHKDAGHSSKILIPTDILEALVTDAERYRALPTIAKDAAKHMEAA